MKKTLQDDGTGTWTKHTASELLQGYKEHIDDGEYQTDAERLEDMLGILQSQTTTIKLNDETYMVLKF